MPDTNQPCFPTISEVESFITDYALPLSIAELNHISFLTHRGDNTLVLGQNTKYQATFQIGDDNTVHTDPTAASTRLQYTRQPTTDIFTRIIQDIASKTKDKISQHLNTFLDLNDINPNHQRHHPRTEALLKIYTNNQVQTSITAAAAAATNSITGDHIQDPSLAGYSALHQFLGPSKVNRAIHLAGANAVPEDLNTIAKHQKAFDDAHRANPNAVITWFSALYPSYEAPKHLDLSSIIQDAKTWFYNNCRKEGLEPTQKLWEVFTQLNPSAVRRCPPAARDSIYPLLCQRALDAGVQPPYSAVANLLSNPYALTMPAHDVQNYLRKSRNRADNHHSQKPQEDLWHDFAKAYLPSDITSPKQASPTRQKPPPNRKIPLTQHELAAILLSQETKEIIKQSATSVTLDIVPGQSLKLASQDEATPHLTVTKGALGRLDITSHNYSTMVCLMPNRGWNTRGLVQRTVTRAVTQHLTRNWKTIAPGPNYKRPTRQQTAEAVRHFLQNNHEQQNIPTDTELSIQMAQAITAMIDPNTLSMANSLAQRVSPEYYNLAADVRDHLSRLQQTNPGTVAWAFNQANPQEPINHPGQFITMTKQSMVEHGLHPANWKYSATLNANTMEAIVIDTSPSAATLILNQMAKYKAHPNAAIARHMATELIPSLLKHSTQSPSKEVLTANTEILTALMCVESHQAPTRASYTGQFHILNQSQEIKDYVLAKTLEGTLVNSTTWKGLVNASDRWHRQFRRTQMQKRWHKTVANRGGWYHASASALDQFQLGPCTLSALNNEKQLLEDSTDMNHCVFTYAPGCAAGNSRIFTVTEKGRKVATCQFLLDATNTWRTAQTRGHHNEHLPVEFLNLMETAATIYHQAWLEEHPHHQPSWYIKEDTGETASIIPGSHNDTFAHDNLPF